MDQKFKPPPVDKTLSQKGDDVDAASAEGSKAAASVVKSTATLTTVYPEPCPEMIHEVDSREGLVKV